MKKGGGAGVGSVTLIMFFSVLCLTVFAVLSLSSARAELSLTNRYVDSVEGYYEADVFATEVFYRLLKADNLMEEAEILGREMDFDIEVVRTGDEMYAVNYIREIGETLSLIVALELAKTDVDARKWQSGVVSWSLTDSADWSADDKLEVWDGT